jgi:SAM-dependent methyltransferase
MATGPTSDAGSNDEAMESIRNDAFEHAYAVRWLTALVAQKTTLRGHDDDVENENDVNPNVEVDASASASKTDKADRAAAASTVTEPAEDSEEALVQSAAALLAVCAGTASAGTRTRTYVLCGVRVQLTDVALRNDDFGSVGAQTWGSACVLAEMIAEAPDRFGVCCADDDDGGDGPQAGAGIARVLELGAGTGLVSLTISKILETSRERDSRRAGTVVVASDFYPPALENLKLNIQRNFPPEEDDGADPAPSARNLSISEHFLDWEEAADPARALQAPFDEPFDEVFGADIVYELEHAMWIKACLKRVLRSTGRFHLVIPLREKFARESATVERVFPLVEDTHRETEVGPTLCITQKENITCEAWPDGKGEVEYVHYTIQWAPVGDR